jgi:signal transduction histidine kinase
LRVERASDRARIQHETLVLSRTTIDILRNAVKFTPAGGTITIATRNDDDELVVECIDSGIGIDPDELRSIFDPFHRTSQTSGRQSGLGLGLAICRRIIDLHGGRIEAESAGQGMGTCMRVRLRAEESRVGSRNDRG